MSTSDSGIYRFVIDGKSYIGKAKDLASRRRRYEANVRNLRAGIPYHIKGRDYRRVHYAMAEAEVIEYEILEYCEVDILFAREASLIAEMKPELNGRAIR